MVLAIPGMLHAVTLNEQQSSSAQMTSAAAQASQKSKPETSAASPVS